ncbi:TonB-dependent receptor [Mucilaginibacter ginkgonis]|uniref:TonB-dependent receptor n=1 Tax=Mucilaginibacter ginkgonis TaxID=2682091 RepID=A0A6I4IN91_9SPHI|nr:TonB-dependent receptor [Mucilaginibacter ginkgonis]
MATIALLFAYTASAQIVLSGKITDGQNNTPLPGATVTVNARSVAADAAGNYRTADLAAGNYTIKVSFIGFKTVIETVYLADSRRLDFSLTTANVLDDVNIVATRASRNSPTAFTNLSRKDIQKNNLGQDLPYLLMQTPSAVTTSDAGAGVGYTGIRIRGSDGTRVNVTINGIPYNDAESQGTYFVDLPDFASSVDNIQIQRGVGTSTNGAGAFGGSINIQTAVRRDSAYAELNNAAGSYGTVKNTVSIGTGLLDNHFEFDGRLSRIRSDGYIQRSASELKSYFFSGAYFGKNNSLRLNVFSGQEKTHQAWNGVNADSVAAGNRRYNELGYIAANGTYYPNQTDNYTQNHYQLLYNQQVSDQFSFGAALHYTKGLGYYEEYKNDASLADYGLIPVTIGGVTITNTDLVRRLWLKNDFYGVTYNLNYQPTTQFKLLLGGAYNEYKGAHYNNIEYTAQSAGISPDYEYSRNNAKKTDFNTFLRAEYETDKFLLYGDLQYRHVYYSFLGFDRNLNNVQQTVGLNFFNPKVGITYKLNSDNNLYASFGVGNHEPNRDDYVNSTPSSRPKAETLYDWEAGYRLHTGIFSGGINGFYMLYDNQLVLTGSLNDVGEAIRTNIKTSYRRGVEIDGRLKIIPQLVWAANAAISSNKVEGFQQYLFNYDTNTPVVTSYGTTDIAFSPNLVANSELSFHPLANGEIALISKYVSRQYLDNTSNINPTGVPSAGASSFAQNRYLNSYFVNSLRLNYNFSIKAVKNIGITVLVNNIFGVKYESNGATYPDIEGGKVVNYNYFYPQVPTNFLASLNLKF